VTTTDHLRMIKEAKNYRRMEKERLFFITLSGMYCTPEGETERCACVEGKREGRLSDCLIRLPSLVRCGITVKQ